ncbi:MAG: metallophosphoesterase [Pseudobdellovibrio sp.]|nr:metallophosphoesterase [Pseudobdellovibrio sp.]
MKSFIALATLLFVSLSGFAEELRFAVVGDAGFWNNNSKSLLTSITNFKTQKMVMPGDNIYKGTYEQAWAPWKNAGITFDVVAIGNHHLGYANEVKYFGMPGEYFAKSYLNGEVLFLVLNSDNTKTVNEQMTWFESQLKSTTAKQVYVVYHHPSLTIGEHKWTEKKEFQIKIRSLFKTYRSKITAAIVGHDHVAALINFDNLPVIVSGSAQSPDKGSPVNNVQEGIQVKSQIYLSAQPYWVQQITSGGDSAEFNFIRAKDNKVLCKAVIQTGMRETHSCVKEFLR